MKRIIKHSVYVAICLLTMVACNQGEGETVESAYVLPLPPEPVYKFARSGNSSVDVQECTFLSQPLNYIYNSYLREARLTNTAMYELMADYYLNGQYGLKPEQEISASPLHKNKRKLILDDVQQLFDACKRISGYNQSDSYNIRRREAKVGSTGYVGMNAGDPNLFFVDEKGCVVAEVFRNYMMGAVYLDKIQNLHLNDSLYADSTLITNHQNVLLVAGRNYTHLEHHWDLAYGYYNAFWKVMAQADGLPILKDSHRTIFEAFVHGRIALKIYHYHEVRKHLQTIKSELSKVIAIRIMNLLLGVNTIANINEAPEYAFGFLSQAQGLLYALQFASTANGVPYFSRTQVLQMVAQLTAGNGFWEQNRLLSDVHTEGSLLHIATQVGLPLGITPADIKR